MHILKKIAAALSSLILIQSAGVFTAVNAAETETEPVIVYEENGYYMGDVNNDSEIDIADVVMLQSFLINRPVPKGAYLSRADMTHDGILNIFDMILLKSVAAGMHEPQWIEKPSEPEGTLISPTVKLFGNSTPSTGNAKMLAIYVDFADKTYSSKAYSTEQMKNELFGNGTAPYPYDSITAWYERSSYGNLHIDGDVYRYTCPGNMSDYMNSDRVFEQFVMEVLTGLDSQIDYSDYDENNDGIIDCIMFTVPLDGADQATLDYWYGCTATWYNNPQYSVDGMKLNKYIIMDVMPYADNMTYLKQTAIHEMGHSLGLPDYYLYQSYDWENLKGNAGYERMDDSIGDFCSFSKLMYGWLKDTEVQSYEGSGSQTFMLDDASNTGSCLILPISSSAGDYTSEYFLVEYITKSGNNSDIYTRDSGVRVFHIQADLHTTYWGDTNFKYEGFSEMYMGDDKIRVVRLVNDGNGFYHTGDTVSFGTSNFAGYDPSGYQTIDTGYTISIGELKDGKYSVTVNRF